LFLAQSLSGERWRLGYRSRPRRPCFVVTVSKCANLVDAQQPAQAELVSVGASCRWTGDPLAVGRLHQLAQHNWQSVAARADSLVATVSWELARAEADCAESRILIEAARDVRMPRKCRRNGVRWARAFGTLRPERIIWWPRTERRSVETSIRAAAAIWVRRLVLPASTQK
jgi:hypothetical protein